MNQSHGLSLQSHGQRSSESQQLCDRSKPNGCQRDIKTTFMDFNYLPQYYTAIFPSNRDF